MINPPEQCGGGWVANFFRIVGIVICTVLMAGFGLCGLMGVAVVSFNPSMGVLMLALAGLAIAYACYLAIRALSRAMAADSDGPGKPAA